MAMKMKRDGAEVVRALLTRNGRADGKDTHGNRILIIRNTRGAGWDVRFWTVAPVRSWQEYFPDTDSVVNALRRAGWCNDADCWPAAPAAVPATPRIAPSQSPSTARTLAIYAGAVLVLVAILLCLVYIGGSSSGTSSSSSSSSNGTGAEKFSYKCSEFTVMYAGKPEKMREVTKYDSKGYKVDSAVIPGRCP